MITDSEKILAALGPLAGLYADPDVLEIMVDTPERVLVERRGHLEDAGLSLGSPEAIRAVIDALLALNEDSSTPGAKQGGTILPIRFAGSEARGVAVLPPTALQGPCLVIRKLVRINPITWEMLLEYGSISRAAYEFLQRAVCVPVNILVAGGTGSGKTTFANRLAELIPGYARLVIVENIHELQIAHPRAVYLEAAGQPGASINELIQVGSIMRPDWLIIGELTGPEAMRAVEVLGRGHAGMTTVHANSLEDALARLEAMCLTAAMGLGLLEIRSLLAAAIQLVCYQKRLPNGRRKVVEIAEIRGVENGQLVVEPLFRYNSETDCLEATGVKASWE